MGRWFLGAYALYASLANKTAESDRAFFQGLIHLPHLCGLELPFYADLLEEGDRIAAFIEDLPKHWDYIITGLPGTMQALTRDARIGLGSTHEPSRQIALERMALLHRRVHEIHQTLGRRAVRAIELHSAPRADQFDGQSFQNSLASILAWDWQGVQLILEHCDGFRADGSHSKGFQDLTSEMNLLQDLPVTMGLNWGRSVLDHRDADGAMQDLRVALPKLASFFFSGTAASDPLYGIWQDNHAPLACETANPWHAKNGLLTADRVTEILHVLKERPDVALGIKVQPAPASLTVAERLAFAKEQITAFEALWP